MHKLSKSLAVFLVVFLALAIRSQAQNLVRNPILFVTVIPNAEDSATQSSVIASHLAGATNARRGGDLWIRYPDGSLKNLTAAAGFGCTGWQLEKSIAVRQPSVHWSGKKALISMIVGAPKRASDTTKFYWQIYEVEGLGQDESPKIQLVPGQPLANNIAPIYGTGSNIVFVSDAARLGQTTNYAYLDESLGMLCNSGLWSLNLSDQSLYQLDHSPSGDYNPSMDSYGRIVFSRWDILQQDQVEALSGGALGLFNYDSENSTASPSRTKLPNIFPDLNPHLSSTSRGSGGYFDTTININPIVNPNDDGTLFDAALPNDFFPWTIREDGSGAQTINHIGRHDLRDTIAISTSFSSDNNIRAFSSLSSGRPNRNPINNFLQIREDPTHPGSYFGIDALAAGTHGGGQIVCLENASPSNSSKEATIRYITSRATRRPRLPIMQGVHTGFYRNPLPTSDGLLIASHATTSQADPRSRNLGVASHFDYRLKLINVVDGASTPGVSLTSGIAKSVYYPNLESPVGADIEFSGQLWEMDAVEVVERSIPTAHETALDEIEASVFAEEGVDLGVFRQFLLEKKQALIVSRNITHRDPDDKQQPYFLNIFNGVTSPNASGRIYTASDLMIYQADYLRSYGANPFNLRPGRRVLATPVHDVKNKRYVENNLGIVDATSNVDLASDGSFAAFVPTSRAISWQLRTGNAGLVSERYWVTFAPGEIRTCVRCHGENDEAQHFSLKPPTNKPFALRGLLRTWKHENAPARIRQTLPQNFSTNQSLPLTLQWESDPVALGYQVSVYALNASGLQLVLERYVAAPTTSLYLQQSDLSETAKQYQWVVRGVGKWANSDVVVPFVFTSESTVDVKSTDESSLLQIAPIPASDVIHINYAATLSGIATVSVVDVLGNTVFTKVVETKPDLQDDIPVQALTPGIYEIVVESSQHTVRRKCLIHR